MIQPDVKTHVDDAKTTKLSKSQLRKLKKKAKKHAAQNADEKAKEDRRRLLAVVQKSREERERQENDDENAAASTKENESSNELESGKVEVEYVSTDLSKMISSEEDPSIIEAFSTVFSKFSTAEELCNGSEVAKKEKDSGKNGSGENEDDKNDDDANGEGKDSEKEKSTKLSRKQRKKMSRLSVAELKQLVGRSDVVEAHDVTSADPRLLVALKSCRNTVPVPRHWCHKRKYLQGKRGYEKHPFSLPEYIANTGIADVRGAALEEEERKKGRQKARERVQPKMGRIDIDYQVLHDAFFKYQTKPKMTILGDLYYEGKEFEVKVHSKVPGVLSDKLRQALGMTDGVPPPWLLHMQRYGPPPSYPNLKIAGLNAPIPEGASFGYHPGGWGKPPVNEQGLPLYGNVFANSMEISAPTEGEQEVSKDLWGELDEEEEAEEEEEEDDDEDDDEDHEEHKDNSEDHEHSGLETPTPSDGFSSIASGLTTPGMVDLRKGIRGTETPESVPVPQQLYQVLEQKQASVGRDALYGSTHEYVVVPEEQKEPSPSVTSSSGTESRKRKAAADPTSSSEPGTASSTKSKKYKDFKF